MPVAGTTITISASYGSVKSSNFTKTVLQPITSFDLNCAKTDNAFYNKEEEKLYIDQTYDSKNPITADFTYTVDPVQNDDSLFIGTTDDEVSGSLGINSFTISLTNKAKTTSELNIAPRSGYGNSKTIDVIKCVPLKSYTVTANGSTIGDSSSGGIGGTKAIAGDKLTISPAEKKAQTGTPNDVFDYKLYTDSSMKTLVPSSYYSVDTSYNCNINIPNPGTYYLVCSAKSLGDGCLPRTLSVTSTITISEAKPIESIKLYQLDENSNKTSTELTDITLYTNSAPTYDLSKNVTILPVGYTHSINYQSQNTDVATVNATTGLVTAKSTGDSIIYAVSDDSSSVITSVNVHVRVGIINITSVNAPYTELPAGHSEQLSIVTNPTIVDEKISWSSADSNILTVDQTGKITAVENYNFGNETSKIVAITAKSEFGISKVTYITVVPAKRATQVDISVTPSTESETFVTNGDTYSDYVGKTYNLSCSATDANGNESNDILVWKVSVGEFTFLDLNSEEVLNYIKATYNSNDNTYKVTVNTTEPVYFYASAQRSGEEFSTKNEFKKVTIASLAKVTSLSIIDPDTAKGKTNITMPTNSTTGIKVTVNIDANDSDPITFTSRDTSIASVAVSADPKIAYITTYKVGTTYIDVTTRSGNKTGTVKVVVSNNIDYAYVDGVASAYVYTGADIKPAPTVIFDGITLTNPTHYTLTYTNVRNAGVATMTIVGKGDFNTSSKIITYNIVPKTMHGGNIALGTIGNQTLTNTVRAVEPKPSVKDTERNVTLKLGTDYTLSYAYNYVAGTGTVYVSGIGNYTGVVSTTFNIIDQANTFYIAPISAQNYTGKARTPAPAVYYNGNLLTNGVHYTLTYSNNTYVGTATVTVTGIGNFTGKTSSTFTIQYKKPKTTSISKLSKSKKSFKVSWKKTSSVTGYQISYSTSKKFTSKTTKTVKVKGYKSTSKTIKSLKAKKKYYVRVRTYKTYTVNRKSTTVYSSWSKTKTVTTK